MGRAWGMACQAVVGACDARSLASIRECQDVVYIFTFALCLVMTGAWQIIAPVPAGGSAERGVGA